MQINKYIAGILLAFGLAATPAMAACEHDTVENLQVQVDRAKEIGAVAKVLTNAEVAEVLDKVGKPPNAVEDMGIGIIRVDHEGWAALFFTQNGCYINRIGPVPVDLLNMRLGITSAGEKVD